MQIIVCIAIAIYALLLGFVLGALFAVKCLAKVAEQSANCTTTKDNTINQIILDKRV
jgi:ABC-type arginine transport system permease subunit